MRENQFDETFKNKLQDHSSQVSEEVWQKIRQRQDRDRKAVPFWKWYFILPLSLLALSAAGYFIELSAGGDKTSHDKTSPKTASTKETPQKESPKEASKETYLKKKIAIEDSSQSDLSMKPFSKKGPFGKSFALTSPSGNLPDKKNSAKKYFAGKRASKKKTLEREASEKDTREERSLEKPSSKTDLSEMGFSKTGSSKTNAPLHWQVLKRIFAETSSPQIDFANKIKAPPPVQPQKSKKTTALKAGHWYFDLFASPDIPINEVNSVSKLSPTIGVRVIRTFGSHFSASAGFQYSRVNGRSIFTDSSGLQTHQERNRLTSIDIPLLIGYSTGGDHFRAAVNTGIVFNVHSWSEGIFSYPMSDPYKSNTGLSAYLGINLAGKITDKIQVFTEPYFKYRLSNMTIQPYSQKINIAGLSLGVRYDLKKNRR